MKMDVQQANAQWSRLVDAALTADEVIIAKAGKPCVRLVRLVRLVPLDPPARQPGSAKGKARLPGPHRDPFDRMLMAQARIEQALVLTVDPVFGEYGLAVVW